MKPTVGKSLFGEEFQSWEQLLLCTFEHTGKKNGGHRIILVRRAFAQQIAITAPDVDKFCML
jgi:hypothetical protein